MITEYTDAAELMRLIADQKIKPSAVRRYLSRHGMVFTAANSNTLLLCVTGIYVNTQNGGHKESVSYVGNLRPLPIAMGCHFLRPTM